MSFLDFEKELSKSIYNDYHADVILNLSDLSDMSS